MTNLCITFWQQKKTGAPVFFDYFPFEAFL